MSNLAQVFSYIHGEKKQLFLETSQYVSMRELFQSWSCGMRRQKQLVLANLTWHYRQKILPWASAGTELYQHKVFLENFNHERTFFSQARQCPLITNFLEEGKSWSEVNHDMPSWDQLRDDQCGNVYNIPP